MSEPAGLGDPRTARDYMLQDHDVPIVLVRALDRVPRGWVLLCCQNELSRLGSPESNRRLAEETRASRWLLYRATEAERHLERVREMGFDFDFEKDLLTIPTAGRPRSLLRDLVAALDAEVRRVRIGLSRAEKLEVFAKHLSPYFAAEWTTSAPKGLLARTYDNV